MKSIKTLVFVSVAIFLMASTPVKINRITRQSLDFKFYNEQSALWKKETERKPKNAEAWQNYFLALRYANMIDPAGPKEERKKAIKEAIAAMQKYVPNTIEFYRCKLKDMDGPSGVTNPDALAMMEKGLAIDPNDDDILESMIVYCETSGKTEKLKEYYTRLYNTNVNPYPVMEYNYNVLMSVDKNAIVFTCGDNDSYPAWMLQQVKGIRTDVSVINIWLAQTPDYLKRILKQKNIVLSDNVLEVGKRTTDEFIKQLVLEINKKYPDVPVFFALTYNVQGVFEDSLYCMGLAHKFSTVRIDNISKLKSNIETKFHLDYLNNDLIPINPINKELVENFNTNYIIPFAMLYKHYKNMDESGPRAEFYKNYCMEYATKRGKEQEMKECLYGK